MNLKLIYSRKHSNGDATWWRPHASGYTTDIQSAGRYTEEEADAHCRSTHGDSVPIDEADAIALISMRVAFTRDVERHLSAQQQDSPLSPETIAILTAPAKPKRKPNPRRRKL